MGARYYDPQAGHFLSPDPLGHAASPDLYSAFNGDPVNNFDPDGRLGKNSYLTGLDIVESPYNTAMNLYNILSGNSNVSAWNLFNPLSPYFLGGLLVPAQLAGGWAVSVVDGKAWIAPNTYQPGSQTTSVNGIFNNQKDAGNIATAVNNVYGVNNTVPSDNQSTLWGVGDIIQVLAEEVGLITTPSVLLAQTLEQDNGGGVIAHSNGTDVFAGAMSLVPMSVAENINYQGFGGQTYINNSFYGLNSAMNTVNPGDPVPYMSPWNYLAGFGTYSDETMTLPANNNSGIGIGFQYHLFGPNYQSAIQPPY
jgi:hypothetical protein